MTVSSTIVAEETSIEVDTWDDSDVPTWRGTFAEFRAAVDAGTFEEGKYFAMGPPRGEGEIDTEYVVFVTNDPANRIIVKYYPEHDV